MQDAELPPLTNIPGFASSARRCRLEAQRRDAHGLPGFQPVLWLGALAVDPHLAFTDDALDVGEAQARKALLEKTVDAHAGFIGGDGDVLHARRHLNQHGNLCFAIPGCAADRSGLRPAG